MRMFRVHNRAYNPRLVLAVDAEQAIHSCIQTGHLKRPQMVRRIRDVTDTIDQELMADSLKALLRQGQPGILTFTNEGWSVRT